MTKRLLSLALVFVFTALSQNNPGETKYKRWEHGIYRGKLVRFQVVDGLAIYQGDIIIGKAEDLISAREALGYKIPIGKPGKASLVVSDPTAYWPKGIIPYVIDPSLKDPSHIQQAINHWQDRTLIRFVQRTNEANWVTFKPSSDNSVCSSSSLGVMGGEQFIFGSELCPAGALIHEIGHAVGLEHEQARSDRGDHVTILFENIQKAAYGQFDAFSDSPYDVGDYDFGSIMHYGATDFSKNGLLAIETIPAGIPIGQTTALSAGDIDAVIRIYAQPKGVTIATNPARLRVIVDGEAVATPVNYSWSVGSTHTLDVEPSQTDSTARYVFGRWSNDGTKGQTIQVDQSTSLFTANMIRYIRIQPSISPADAGTVTITPASSDGYYLDGSLIQATVTPNPGYYFTAWTSDFLTQKGYTNLATNPIKGVVDERRSGLTANFSTTPPVTFRSTASSAALLIDGKRYFTPAAFIWEGGTTHTVEADASFPDDGGTTMRVFDSWSDGTDRAHSITAGTDAATYTATFRTKHLLDAFAYPSGAGTVSLNPSSDDGFFDEGSTVQITGVPASAYKFAGFTFDMTGSANSQSIVVGDYRSVAAMFARPGTIQSYSILHAATLQPTLLVPGQAITIYSPEFGPDASADAVPGSDGKIATTLSDTRVLFSGLAAPVLSVSKNQTTAVVPYAVDALSQATVQVEYKGQRTTGLRWPVDYYDPGVYTIAGNGKGQSRVFNEDGTPNSTDNPAAKGSVVKIIGTGLGTTTPNGNDGKVGVQPLPVADYYVDVRIGGKLADIVFAGGAEGQVAGISQIQARVPDTAPSGPAVTLVLLVEGYAAQFEATIAIQ